MILPLYAILDLGLLASELALVRWRHSSRAAKTERADRGSHGLLWLVIPLAITAGHFLALGGVGPRLPGRGFAWWQVGVGVFVLGTALRWWAIRHLGRFFSVDVALAADHRVVDTGPYRAVRHPSYTGLLGQLVGLGLVLGNVAGLVVIVVPIFLALAHRIRVEEDALLAGLGKPYADYAGRTRRLVPGIF